MQEKGCSMQGRKPKPTALHELHGNPSWLGKKTLAARRKIEPPPTASRLEPPIDFTPAQTAIWEDAVTHAPPGVIRRLDASVLTAWVLACDLHRRAREGLNTTGLLVSPSRDENSKAQLIASPLLAILNRQAVVMLRAAEQLGFSPVSRPRLAAMAGLAPLPEPNVPSATSTKVREDVMPLDDYLASAPPIPRLH
jgi:P27 family predicted phage terminase small subunit